MSSVYILNETSKEEYKKIYIGSIDDSNNITVNESMLFDYNKKILEYIAEDKEYKTDVLPPHKIVSNDIIGHVIHILRWRRCTAYLVIQTSDTKKVRCVCYLYTKIKHSSSSFGTDCDCINVNDVKKQFITSISLLNEYRIPYQGKINIDSFLLFGELSNV